MTTTPPKGAAGNGPTPMTIVVKIGSSSLTAPGGGSLDSGVISELCEQVARLKEGAYRIVVVTSGAVAAGSSAIFEGRRPTDMATLQAVSAIGQHRLMREYDEAMARHGILVGQILLAPLDFVDRQQYLHARQTLMRLLDLGVVPVVNENDATSDDEIRFGDNDRLAALVAHLVGAEMLVLLTDAPGLLTGDPRTSSDASLIEEVLEVDHTLENLAAGPGSELGSGGMTSKLAAAKMASWSGVQTVIADASREDVLIFAVAGKERVGTVFRARSGRLPARKLWIAFAVAPAGSLVVDDGARRALEEREASLLPAGVVSVTGNFTDGSAVEILDRGGVVFAKGLVNHSAQFVREWAGRRTGDLPDDVPHEIVHRDDLVLLR